MFDEVGPDTIARTYGNVPEPSGDRFEVWRHGGHSNHRWRLVFENRSKPAALEHFNALAGTLRQGCAFLREPTGRIIAARSSPRLRTIW